MMEVNNNPMHNLNAAQSLEIPPQIISKPTNRKDPDIRNLDKFYHSTKRVFNFNLLPFDQNEEETEFQANILKFKDQIRIVLKIARRDIYRNILVRDKEPDLAFMGRRQNIYVIFRGPSELLNIIKNSVGSLCQMVPSESPTTYQFFPETWEFSLVTPGKLSSPTISLKEAKIVPKGKLLSRISLTLRRENEKVNFESNKFVSFQEKFQPNLPIHYHKTGKSLELANTTRIITPLTKPILDSLFHSTKRLLNFNIQPFNSSEEGSIYLSNILKFKDQIKIILKVHKKNKVYNALAQDNSNLVIMSRHQQINVILRGPSELLTILRKSRGSLYQKVQEVQDIPSFTHLFSPCKFRLSNQGTFLRSPKISLFDAKTIPRGKLLSKISLALEVGHEDVYFESNEMISFQNKFEINLPQHYRGSAKTKTPSLPSTASTLYPLVTDSMRQSVESLPAPIPSQNGSWEMYLRELSSTNPLEPFFQQPANKKQKRATVDEELKILEEQLKSIKKEKELHMSLIKELQSKYSQIISKERFIRERKGYLLKGRDSLELLNSFSSADSTVSVAENFISDEGEILNLEEKAQ